MSQRPFKPKNVRDAHKLSEHELRSWRQLLPPFSEQMLEKGKDPGFGYGDLLAFGIFAVLIKRIGLKPETLKPMSKFIVDHCNQTLWEQLGQEQLYLEVNLETGISQNPRFISQVDNYANQDLLCAHMVVPLQVLLMHVTGYLEQQGFQPARQQLNLRYPPSVVTSQ